MSMIISRKYEVLDQIGKGGMGVVHKVRHVTLDTIFALKALPRDMAENPEMVSRFYREARVVARLSHPHIVHVSDIDHDDELQFHYFVMEYIQGQTFAQYLRDRGPLPLPDVLTVGRQVAQALSYAHGCTPPIIHRDIKPANIMIEDCTGRVVVMDFGIAKELDSDEMTKSGMAIGTYRYCAPEQMRHEALDGRADIYSLGMVLYEAYTGSPFFADLEEAEVIGKVLYDLEEHEPMFPRPAPPAFAALVKKAIAKSRDRRHRTIDEFLRELDACDAVNADVTDRIILPSPATCFSSGGNTREGVKELEEQIRRLEEERQRRLVLSAQAQAQEARERAARGDVAAVRESYRSTAHEFPLAEQRTLTEQQRVHAQEEEPQSQERQKPPIATPLEQRQTLSLPSIIEGATKERAERSPYTPALPWVLVGAGLLISVSGFYWITVARSVAPQLQTASSNAPLAASPMLPQSERQKKTLSVAATDLLLPPTGARATASLPPPSQRFIDSDRITKYTDVPFVHIQATVVDAAQVFLDGREMSVSIDGVLHLAFSDLPVGESEHRLRLVGKTPERTQEIPVEVRYYPRWEMQQFVDERDEAYAVAISPDGHLIASTSRDKVVKLWDRKTGLKIRTLVGHREWVTSAAFSPDGQTILSCSDDRTVRLWEVATGKRIRTLTGHRDFVNGVAFSPDGKMAVSGSKDNTVKLWNVQTGREIRTLVGHRGWVLAVAFSPDGKSVLSGGVDATMKLWDVTTGQVLRTFSGHRDAVFAVAFAPDGKTVLSGSHDNTIRLWEVETGQVIRTFSGHGDWVNSVAFSPDGQTFVSGSKDRTVRLWRVATGQAVRIFVGHESTVAGVAFAPEGKTVVSASRDKTLRLWWAALEAPPEQESALETIQPGMP